MPGRTTTAGNAAELAAGRFLQRQGLRQLDSNFRSRFGEIDLVMEDGDTIVFVEVRLRRDGRFGGAAGSVTAAKQQRLLRTAAIYLERHSMAHRPARFDIVAFDGKAEAASWLRDAFRPES